MAYDGEDESWGALMLAAAKRVRSTTWTSIPGQVKRFDPETGCADISPLVTELDEHGEVQGLPVIPCVPVCYPAGAGVAMVWGLAPGVEGIVLFSSRSMAQWIVSGNSLADPEGARQGSLADGMFLPLRPAPQTDPTPGVDSDLAPGQLIMTASEIRAGSTTALDPVALSSLVAGELTAISIAFGIVATALAISNPYPSPGNTASTVLKSE